MQTLKLKVDDGIYEKVLWLLSKFSKEEIEILTETPDFETNKKDLESELNEILKGEARFLSVEEAEKRLNNSINQHENII
ncbi:MAG: tRNA pseudouridine synthase A [Bacteroidota bacterium]